MKTHTDIKTVMLPDEINNVIMQDTNMREVLRYSKNDKKHGRRLLPNVLTYTSKEECPVYQ